MYNKESYFYGTGRRKSSVARVRLYQGTGKVTINTMSFGRKDQTRCLTISSAAYVL